MRNAAGSFALVIVLSLIALAVHITGTATPLWAMLLVHIFAVRFPWTEERLLRNMAGMSCLTGELALIGATMWYTHDATPLWAVILVIMLAVQFPWQRAAAPAKASE